MPEKEHLGFIGLGKMGGAIAGRLLHAGFPLTVLDRARERMEPLLREGATEANTPVEVANRATIVMASLQPMDVDEVVLGERGIHETEKAGLVFVDLSSTEPQAALNRSSALRQKGIEMLDSPVSGAVVGAENGSLTLFVGGSYETYQRSLPVLQYIGRTVTYLGGSGNGQIGKVINEMMQTFAQLSIYEGLQLAETFGLDLKMFARAASAGCAQSWRLDELVRGVLNRGEKSYHLNLRPDRTSRAIELARSAGLSLPGAEAMHRLFSERNWEVVLDFDTSTVRKPKVKAKA